MTWMLSTSEDDWDNGEEHNMRDEALACVKDFCAEHDVESCHIGRVTRLTYRGLLTGETIDRLCENMEEHDDAAGCEDWIVNMTGTQTDELRSVIAHWMTQHLPPIRWFNVSEIEEVKP